MYRPDNWGKMVEEEYMHYGGDREIFEAGADAILEALKEQGVFTYGHHTPDIDIDDAPCVSGYWVFIPDEVNSTITSE